MGDHTGGHEEPAEHLAPAGLEILRRRVSEFSRDLIKAFLQTGFYSEKHPITGKIIEALFNNYKEMISGYGEISYILAPAGETQDIFVEGLTAKPMRLMDMLKGEMGEHFIKKFVEYFNRNRLVLFSIKSAIELDEFVRFISLVVGWHLQERTAQKDGAQFDSFTESLINEGIRNVTVIHINDLVGSEYQLPWQIRIAMTRLRKDLRTLPMFSAVSEEEISVLKRQVVEDIVRPIRRIEIIRDILLYSDIIVPGIPDAEKIDIENEIVSSISYPLAVGTCAKLIEAYGKTQATAPAEKETAIQEKIRRNIRLFAFKLDEQHDYRGRELLEEILNKEILAFEDLPPKTREMVTYKAVVDDFVNNSEAHLSEFERIRDFRVFVEKLRVLKEVAPMLARIRKYKLLSDFFSVLAQQMMAHPQSEVGKTIYEFFRDMRDGGIIELAAGNLAKEKKEVREEIFQLLYPFGTASAVSLLGVLYESDSPQVRHEICEFIAGYKEKARQLIERELSEKRHEWYVLRNLIFILLKIGNPESAKIIVKFVSHEHPRVRIECANALHALIGKKAEPHLIYLVNAEEEEVKRRAVFLLGALRTDEESFFDFIRECVRAKQKDEKECPDALQAACLRALLEYNGGEISLAANGLENALIEAVQTQKQQSLLKRLSQFSRRQFKSDAVRKLMIEVLEKHGSENSREILASLSK
ncbi:MAG: HEAT repeat domain-containing protein [Deltaproteobacteria bacterium]|nr:HEAT repeat domain-containing protein [Deltaproteobacteria bacterium]